MIPEDVLQLLFIVFVAVNPAKTGTKRPATEAVAQLEDAHMTFMDFKGHERYGVAMLDPGASAFLSGFSPACRYLQHWASQGFPIEDVQFDPCRHKFHFGGHGEYWSHWVMQFLGRFDQAQVFLLPWRDSTSLRTSHQ